MKNTITKVRILQSADDTEGVLYSRARAINMLIDGLMPTDKPSAIRPLWAIQTKLDDVEDRQLPVIELSQKQWDRITELFEGKNLPKQFTHRAWGQVINDVKAKASGELVESADVESDELEAVTATTEE